MDGWKKVITILLIFVFIAATNATTLVSEFILEKSEIIYYVAFSPNVYAQSKLIIPEGEKVRIKLDQTVNSENSSVGQIVNFTVVSNVIVNGHVVIKADTPAYGEVAGISKKGSVGKAGTIALTVRYTDAVDGQRVPLRANFQQTGEDKLGTSVALSVVLCPLFLMKKGGEAEYTAGTQFEVFVDRDVEVHLQPQTRPQVQPQSDSPKSSY